MTDLTIIDARSIRDMSYVEFISLLGETNRCPGGKHSIRKILQDTFVGPHSQVLEIGSNTGFTTLEIARTVGASVMGIDPVPDAVAHARQVLSRDTEAVQNAASFEVGSAYDIPFEDGKFDLVICGGATSFMDDKTAAVDEYHRVLKPWAFLSVTNLCYFTPPPPSVVKATSEVIGVQLETWGPDDYLRLFRKNDEFEVYTSECVYLGRQPDERISDYIAYFMQKPHLAALSAEVRAAIETRWRHTIDVFNANHEYLGYVRAILRRAHIPEEPELFLPQAQ